MGAVCIPDGGTVCSIDLPVDSTLWTTEAIGGSAPVVKYIHKNNLFIVKRTLTTLNGF